VYVNGAPQTGVYGLFAGLNIAESLKLDHGGPYWTDPKTFQALSRIGQIAISAPYVDANTTASLKVKGIDTSPDAQLRKDYAQGVAPLLDQIFVPPAESGPKHSNAIVVVDREGNIAAITHTINTVTWGDTGIVVDGIPIPDSAGFQQATLASIKPGDRVPHQIIDTIAFDGESPVLATSSVGTALTIESIRVLLGVLGQQQDLETVMAAPPLLVSYDTFDRNKATTQQAVSIVQDGYDPDFVTKLKALGLQLTEIPFSTALGVRGTLAAVAIDPKTGKRAAVEYPGVLVFDATE
jgi:gamma-glutamyltranspeptidase / glutathione hydrolase